MMTREQQIKEEIASVLSGGDADQDAEFLFEALGEVPDVAPPVAVREQIRASVTPPRWLGATLLGAVGIAGVWSVVPRMLADPHLLETGSFWAILVAALALGRTALTWPRTALAGVLGVAFTAAVLSGEPGLDAGNVLKCIVFELACAAIPLGVAYARQRTWTMAQAGAVAASGALAGSAALEISCPGAGFQVHLLVSHAVGVALAAGAGAGFAGVVRWRLRAA